MKHNTLQRSGNTAKDMQPRISPTEEASTIELLVRLAQSKVV